MRKVLLIIFLFYSSTALSKTDLVMGVESGWIGYPKSIQSQIDLLSQDFPPFFFHVGTYPLKATPTYRLGFMASGGLTTYSAENPRASVWHLELSGAISGIYFLSGRVGSGLFFKTDIGMKRLWLANLALFSPLRPISVASWGPSSRVQIGYGISNFIGQTLLIQAGYSGSLIQGRAFSQFLIGLSAMN